MQGDFSRDSFNALLRFSRVLEQQGRVLLDADRNEMQAIQLHLLRSLARDVIGPHGGSGDGFLIAGAEGGDFGISAGHYYVDGHLCENFGQFSYTGKSAPAQPFFAAEPLNPGWHLVYLDVWERHLSAPERPGLREVALGSADTASRAQVVWQVKSMPIEPSETDLPALRKFALGSWGDWSRHWQPDLRGRLSAKVVAPTADSTGPCAASAEARYRGLENQLYRVEIHASGTASGANRASFKWSRENASVVFPAAEIADKLVRLSSWWRDDRAGLTRGDWVEVLDDDAILRQVAQPLRRVEELDRDTLSVQLDRGPEVLKGGQGAILRRWDHRSKAGALSAITLDDDNAIPIVEDVDLPLEDGINVRFSSATTGQQYRTGDYWLIPARVATQDLIWPQEGAGGSRAPQSVGPHGVEHHYAPVAILQVTSTLKVVLKVDLRLKIKALATS